MKSWSNRLLLFFALTCLLIFLFQSSSTTTVVQAGGIDESAKQNRLGGLTSSWASPNSEQAATAAIIQENELVAATTTSSSTTSAMTMTSLRPVEQLESYGSVVLSDEESFGAFEKNTLNTATTAHELNNDEEISNLLGHLLENQEEGLNGEDLEEEAAAASEGVSSDENEELVETLNDEDSESEIEEASSNTSEGYGLDEALDSSGVATLSTQSEQQLNHKKKLSDARTIIKALRQKRSIINKKLYPLQQLVVMTKKNLEDSKDEENKAEHQHNKIKAERNVTRLQKLKKLNNDKLKNALNNLKKLKTKKAIAYNRLKKLINLHIAKLLKRYKIALKSKSQAVSIYKAQKEKHGKTKFIAPYLVNFAKLDVLIAQKRYSNAMYFYLRRQIFVLNYLVKHRNNVFKVLNYENARSKVFNLKLEEEKKKVVEWEKQLEAATTEVIKNKLKGVLQVSKVKIEQYKKHIATCTILIKRAKTTLEKVALKLKEAAAVLSSRKITLPKGLHKLLKTKYEKQVAAIEKKKKIYETASNKDELLKSLPKPVDYTEKTYIRLALKKNKLPYICTVSKNSSNKEKIESQSVTNDLFLKPLICFHKTKTLVKVSYVIGQNILNIQKIKSKWLRQRVRLSLNDKGRLVAKFKKSKSLNKTSPKYLKKKLFNDRVKYIQTHQTTSRAIIKSFVMKYYALPNDAFNIKFVLSRGTGRVVKPQKKRVVKKVKKVVAKKQ
ncbi:hypothetical protein NAEGRDRAFT_59247 [Naegleria gruberi]|uniref:Uncharacterized protein n=1 Tax=Naegleria gruberi TaxID=5762 RepID=D2VUE3_NAEGR|nr:uncharacterized protein NAEGRDRAFT_59247 [Naegleria gruberi]EFC39677.1 hypothetical protein NAEGRDRAFT_59247 [Naegleria gruberi]|eukprot:XP_002672421.1 hypothetical protein NAEGRDRAFT_59247 [Naegleria gruberi strain NEG-M]